MSRRVAILLGRDDDAALRSDGVEVLNRTGFRLGFALKSLGYSDDEIGTFAWELHPDTETSASWRYWRNERTQSVEMSLSIGARGCCLETGVLWSAFRNNARIREACREIAREVAVCLGANTAIFAPDNSELYNSGCSRLQGSGPFLDVLKWGAVADEAHVLIDTWKEKPSS